MNVLIGAAEFDALANPVCIGWCEFDAAVPIAVHVGWCEFDAAREMQVCIGHAEFDAAAPVDKKTPVFRQGGGPDGYSGYYGRAQTQYESDAEAMLLADAEEEEIIMVLLMEIAAHVL